MAEVGQAVQYFDKRQKYQAPGMGEGPYAALVVGRGDREGVNLFIPAPHESMMQRLEKNVTEDNTQERYFTTLFERTS